MKKKSVYKMKPLPVRFDASVMDDCKAIGDLRGQTASEVAREAMEEGIFYLKEHVRFIRDTEQEGDAHLQDDLLK